jgi:hypothetical protein
MRAPRSARICAVHCEFIAARPCSRISNDGDDPMKYLTCLTFALATGVVAMPALASDARVPLPASAIAGHASALSAMHVSRVRAAQPANAKETNAMHPKVMGSQTYPGSPTANPFRAYPPSCAADPLPDLASGTTWSARVPLLATDNNGTLYTENVTVTVWRLACSSSGHAMTYNPTGADNAITLMRIDRDSNFDHDTSIFPTFPLVEASQGGSGFGTQASLVRVAMEPNTVISDTSFDSPIVDSTTYVLENDPYQGSGYFTYSDGFTLRIDPQVSGVAPVDISVPAYSPTQSTYPDAFNPLPIDGYMGTSWYDPTHSGEGMLAEVIDNADGTRTFFASWYTYDPSGLPFWITAQGVFAIGAASVDATGYYQTGGGFAGNFGSSTTQHIWGTLTFSFPNCGKMDFSYNGQTDAQTNGPGGNGSRIWSRVADNNGMPCE